MTLAEAHDPTSSATSYPPHAATPILLSRNEIETLCLKAARGAGMSWGLAEEAGFAAGWLAACGVDGAGALLDHLQHWASGGILVRDRHWTATADATLSPILLGATLDDHAALAAGPWSAPITIAAAHQPILLVPFLVRAAKVCAEPLALIWPSGSLVIPTGGDMDATGMTALSRVEVTTLTLSPASDGPQCEATGRTTAPLSAATLEKLNTLALRTTVPASDASRRGAGAATSDND